jgi:hypothetical protein
MACVWVTGNEWQLAGGGLYSEVGNWTESIVPNGVDAAANFLSKLTSPDSVTVDSPVTDGTITFDNTNSYPVPDRLAEGP